ncbi:MAG: cytochrome c3 family protein [Sandaracinaceae bacterium]
MRAPAGDASGADAGPVDEPVTEADPVEPPGDCRGCHDAEWQGFLRSRHRAAFTGALFQEEWGADHDAFCLPCHAPNVREDAWVEPTRAAAGVDCVACHVEAGVVRATEVSGRAPHPSRVDPSLGSAALCATCHQIGFPGQDDLPLQNTVAEWRAAGEPAGACQTCHMPGRDGGARHDFVGGHDSSLLARALRVEVSRAPGRVRVSIENEGAGHAVPTGDVFRRLVVRAWPVGRPLVARERELGRHLVREGGRWRSVRDDRVPAGGRRVVLLEVPGDGPVEWSIELASQPASLAGVLEPRDRPRPVARGTTAVP